MLGRASALLIVGLALSACTQERPDDAEIAAVGTGIPVGAVGAVGVGFEAPAGLHDTASPPLRAPRKGSRSPGNMGGTPMPQPPDPFADPPGASGHPGPSSRPPSRGTTL